jgi:hypothetical protein
MVKASASASHCRFAQIFERLRPRTRCATVALAILGLWAAFPTPASAGCNGEAPSNLVNRISGAQPFLLRGWAQPTAVAADTEKDKDADDASIVGLWHILLLNPDGTAFDEGYDAWHSDGTEILNDNGQPQPANGAGTVCLGIYKKTGPGTYKLKHPSWSIDANGVLAGVIVILEEVTLDADGNAFSGTYEWKSYDLKGNLTFEQTGDLKADRITPD